MSVGTGLLMGFILCTEFENPSPNTKNSTDRLDFKNRVGLISGFLGSVRRKQAASQPLNMGKGAY